MLRARRVVVLGALWLASVIAISALTAAQVRNTATVYSGENIGFRPSSPGGKMGVLVVRINGEWVDAQLAPRLSPAK
jgi:hypothetical protein